MSKSDVVAAILVALGLTIVLVAPSLITVWVYKNIGISFEMGITIIAVILLMSLNFTFRMIEDE